MLKALTRLLGDRLRSIAGYTNAQPTSVTDIEELLTDDFLVDRKKLLHNGNYKDALRAFDQLIINDPNNAAAWCNRGSAQAALGLLEAAVSSFSRSIDIDPNIEAGYNNLCLALSELGRFDEAVFTIEQGMKYFPSSLPLQLAAATAFYRAGDLNAARMRYEAILEVYPGDTDTRIGLSLVLQDLGDLAMAELHLRDILGAQPQHANARLCLAFLELMQSQFTRGWRDYEARFATAEAPLLLPKLPLWNGESLAEKRIVIIGEQGLGDEIMFSSCIPDLVGRASEIEIWSHVKLISLFQHSFPFARVKERTDLNARAAAESSQFDFQIPIGSLPRLLRASPESFPMHSGYLRADPHRCAAWRDRLHSLGSNPKIGISWRGGLYKTRRALRSISIPEFSSLLDVPDIHFVNLQHDASSEEIAQLRKRCRGNLHSFSDHVADYAELAALIMNLDLVVSVQGSIVHLSGALGRPTWALISAYPEWRYGSRGEKMPWYPSVRLFRQQNLGEWKPTLEAVQRELGPTLLRGSRLHATAQTLDTTVLIQNASNAFAAGNLATACAAFEHVLELEPACFAALEGLEQLHRLHQQPDGRRIAAQWLAAVCARPDSPRLHVGLANARLRLNDFNAARHSAEAALRIDHTCAAAHIVLGRVHLAKREHDEALDCFRLATHFEPGNAAGHCGYGTVLNETANFYSAIPHFRQAITLDPELGEAYRGLALALDKLQRFEEAELLYEKTLEMDPQDAVARTNLGLIRRNQGRYDEALALLIPAVEQCPQSVDALCNLALVQQDLGQLDSSIDLFSRALELAPHDPELHVNRALTYLLKGDFDAGWPEYEWRAQLREKSLHPVNVPRWNGERAPVMRILVRGEQGLGDQIMFASCVPDLIAEGHKVVIECDLRLAPLFARSFSGALVHSRNGTDDARGISSTKHIDRQIPIGSLPAFFRRSAADFPRHSGYLIADPANVEHWRTRLSELGPGLKVGISWRGGAPSTRSHLRTVNLPQLTPLLTVPGTQFVSVQYGDSARDIAALKNESDITVHEFADALADYDQTAALCCALDLVISVQTAIVHLCGSLGKPVWAMIPFAPEWRYMRDTDTLPWYPTARLFRQPSPGNWHWVTSQVGHALEDLVRGNAA